MANASTPVVVVITYRNANGCSLRSLAQLAKRLVLAADILAVRSNLTSSLTSFLLFERFVPLVRVFVNNLWLPKTSSFK
ncbi:hypothetical protein DTO280E4_6546 [Paecilomyces variotii]|nr:hypothetical protein DTO280E4_6546 [Paecilomyces variotii]